SRRYTSRAHASRCYEACQKPFSTIWTRKVPPIPLWPREALVLASALTTPSTSYLCHATLRSSLPTIPEILTGTNLQSNGLLGLRCGSRHDAPSDWSGSKFESAKGASAITQQQQPVREASDVRCAIGARLIANWNVDDAKAKR